LEKGVFEDVESREFTAVSLGSLHNGLYKIRQNSLYS
jgi:hypothetical protein